MIALEQRITNFIQRHILWFGFGALLLISVALRFVLLPFQSTDYHLFLEQWYLTFQSYGGYFGLRIDVGDYNYLYRFLLSLASYFPQATVSVKMISLVFDYVGAAAGGYLVYRLLLGRGVAFSHARLSGLCAATGLLFAPTVLMNAAMWSQCDFAYTAFLLLCVVFLLQDKFTPAFIFYGLAFSFKLQAVFLLPALLIWYLYRRKFSMLQFLWVPVTMLITSLPVIFLHLIDGMGLRSFWVPFSIYANQAGASEQLTLGMPNLYAFLMKPDLSGTLDFSSYGLANGYTYFKTAGIVLLIALLGFMAVLIFAKNWHIDAQGFFLLCIFSLSACVMLLPSMHERYGFAGTVFMLLYALSYRKMVFCALSALALESIIYLPFLVGTNLPCDFRLLACGNLAIFLCFTVHALRHFAVTTEPFVALKKEKIK